MTQPVPKPIDPSKLIELASLREQEVNRLKSLCKQLNRSLRAVAA